jgi:hypothetical protein
MAHVGVIASKAIRLTVKARMGIIVTFILCH